MNSSWPAEIRAILWKEFAGELRSRTGLATGGLFCLVTIVTAATALFNEDVNKRGLRDVCCSQIWVIVLFAAVLTLPRTFLAEEEQGTSDLLRLTARPHAVFWGKAIFNLIQTAALALLVAGLFVGLTGLEVRYPAMFLLCLLSGGAAMTGIVTACGAIASRAANRTLLAGAIALPLIIAPCQWGVAGLRSATGAGFPQDGWMAMLGLCAYAALTLLIAPWIYATIWKS